MTGERTDCLRTQFIDAILADERELVAWLAAIRLVRQLDRRRGVRLVTQRLHVRQYEAWQSDYTTDVLLFRVTVMRNLGRQGGSR